jgi:hypothetical protein
MMAANRTATRASSGVDDDGVERIVVNGEHRAALAEQILESVAEMARFLKQPAGSDEANSLRFDGPSLFTAARALMKYDRLTNPQLLLRRGYALPEELVVQPWVRRRILRAMDDCLADVGALESVVNQRDLPKLRRALRFDGRDRTPARSRDRQSQRNLAVLVRASLARRIVASKSGSPLPGDNLNAVFETIARSCVVSVWTVRRAWSAAKAEDQSLRELHESFQGIQKRTKAAKTDGGRVDATSRTPAKAARSAAKKAIDRVMSKKR